MPATHCQPFQVRFYECDAYGQMQPINYLRRMQEAAFGASAAVGYDFARYDQLGYLWLVRATEIEYFQPLAYGDPVEITTWVHDFRRFRSRRMYQFQHTATGQLAAQAATDWVYVNAQNLRPAVIPESMRQAFFPEGPPEDGDARVRTPAPSEPPAGAFRLRQPVAWGDIDMMGHVNNAVYLGYLQNAVSGLLTAGGWPRKRCQAEGGRLVPRQHQLEYRLSVTLGDELESVAWITEVQPQEVTLHFALNRLQEGQTCVQAQARYQWVAAADGAGRAFPAALLEALGNH